LIECADPIVTLKIVHKPRLNQHFGTTIKRKKIAVLEIQDEDPHREPELVRILEQRAPSWPPKEIKIRSPARCL
jgi:predicted protein tyrosine phosphatase